MSCQGIARQQAMAVIIFNQPLHRIPTVLVKSHCRAQHPNNMAMLTVMAKHLVQVVIASGKGCLSCSASPERELVNGFTGCRLKALDMDVDSLFTILSSTDHDRITFFYPAGLGNFGIAIFQHDDGVHPTFRGKQPTPCT